MNWFIIILIALGIFIVIKMLHFRHLKHRIVGVILVLLLLFISASIYFVAKENKVDMTTAGGFAKGMQIYAGWLVNGFQNIGSITGYTIGLDWSSKNKTVPNNLFINKTGEVGGSVIEKSSGVANKVKANMPKKIIDY